MTLLYRTPERDAMLLAHYPTYLPSVTLVAMLNAAPGGGEEVPNIRIMHQYANRLGLHRPPGFHSMRKGVYANQALNFDAAALEVVPIARREQDRGKVAELSTVLRAVDELSLVRAPATRETVLAWARTYMHDSIGKPITLGAVNAERSRAGLPVFVISRR